MDFSLKNNNSKKTIKSPKSTLIAQGTIEPLKAASIAQGTIEYLVVIAVIIVISLFITTLLITQTDNTEKIGVDSDKASGIIGKGGISVIDSVTSANGESVVSLKNNSGETFTVTKITPIDSQGTLGTSNEYNQDIFPGYEFQFIITDINSICPCVDGKTTTCNIKVTFVDSTGFEKTETLKITNTCILKIDYYYLKYTPTTGGTIIGDLNQNILPGKSGSPVTAQPEEGYTFLQWSDGSTNPTRTETNVNENKTITAEFEEVVEIIGPIQFVPSCWSDAINPHPICNCFDLNQIRTQLSWSYELQNDINMNATECTDFQTGVGFEPIGGCGIDNACWDEGYENYAFKGYFDGQNYTIYNLIINRPEQNYVGLFGMSTSDLNNIHLEGIDITGNESVGGLSAESFGLIYNSSSNGIITGNNYVGGLTGYAGNYNATISLSNSTATINGTDYIGGIAGGSDSKITNCFFNGEINGNDYIGGLVGEHIEFSISNSHSNGEINGNDYVGGLAGSSQNGAETLTNSYSSANVNGNNYVGGLIGSQIYGDTQNSYSSGTIIGNTHIGGLIGQTAESTTSISFSSSEVSGNNYVGGLIGTQNGNVNQVYSTGNVIGIERVGGLVGNQNGEITQAYSESNVTGQSYVGGLVGFSRAQINETWATGIITLEDYGTGEEEGMGAVGGLVGRADEPVLNSYSTGNVIAGDEYYISRVGGLVGEGGEGSNAKIINSYTISTIQGLGGEYVFPLVGMWEGLFYDDVENSYYQAENERIYALGTWKTEAELKQQNTFVEWDFDTIWGINPSTNNGYPYLQWQVD